MWQVFLFAGAVFRVTFVAVLTLKGCLAPHASLPGECEGN